MHRTRWIIGIVALVLFLLYIWWAVSTVTNDDDGSQTVLIMPGNPGGTTSTTTTVPETTTTIEITTTTTTIPSTSTVPPPPPPPSTTIPSTTANEGIFISAVGTTCQKDVPVIVIKFGNQTQFNGMTATLTFIDLNGTVIEKRLTFYEANQQIVELYPGAAVDITTGEAVDWPGWKQNEFGFWVEDPTDAFWRQGLTLLIEVNPSASTQISYPPASSACANPVNPSPPPKQPVIPPAR